MFNCKGLYQNKYNTLKKYFMGSALTTLTLGFKLNELDNNYKKNIEIDYPSCPCATTDLQRAVDADDDHVVAKLCEKIDDPELLVDTLNNSEFGSYISESDILDVSNALMICVMKDRQICFDKCFAAYLRQFTAINIESNTSHKGEKNVVTDLIDDLAYTKTVMTMHLTDIMRCCVWSTNLHYLQQITECLLKHMGILSSFTFFWEPVAIAAKRNNITALNFLDSHEIITQRLLLRVAYGAIAGKNADCLRWVFDNDKKLPVLDCILNAMVYLKWFTMFNEFFPKRDSKNYVLDDTLSEIVLSDDVMFKENVSNNLFSSKHNVHVLNKCLELGLTHEMVELISLPKGEQVKPNKQHIKYIYQHPQHFASLIEIYPHDIITNILCWVIDHHNVNEIIEYATSKSGGLTDARKLMLVSHTRNVSLIHDFLSSMKLSVIDPSEGIEAITHDSNEVLFDVLITKYNLVLTSELLSNIVRDCTFDMCVGAIKLTHTYDPTKIIIMIVRRADDFTINEIDSLLNLVLSKYPEPKIDRYDIYFLGKCQEISKIDLIISKVRSIGTESHLMDTVKYSCDYVAFCHICRNYLSSDNAAKQRLADELKYHIKQMLEGKEFNKLLFLVKELSVPIDFVVLKEIGDKFDESKISIIGNDIEKIKKNGITYQMLEELITLCTERVLANLKKRMESDIENKKRKSEHVYDE